MNYSTVKCHLETSKSRTFWTSNLNIVISHLENVRRWRFLVAFDCIYTVWFLMAQTSVESTISFFISPQSLRSSLYKKSIICSVKMTDWKCQTPTLGHFFVKWFNHIGSIDFWKIFPFSWNLFMKFFCFFDAINSFFIIANRWWTGFHNAFQCLKLRYRGSTLDGEHWFWVESY